MVMVQTLAWSKGLQPTSTVLHSSCESGEL